MLCVRMHNLIVGTLLVNLQKPLFITLHLYGYYKLVFTFHIINILYSLTAGIEHKTKMIACDLLLAVIAFSSLVPAVASSHQDIQKLWVKIIF